MLLSADERSSTSHLAADADRLVHGVGNLLASEGVDGLAVDLVGHAGVVAQAGYRVGDVGVAGVRCAILHPGTYRAMRIPLPAFRLGSAWYWRRQRLGEDDDDGVRREMVTGSAARGRYPPWYNLVWSTTHLSTAAILLVSRSSRSARRLITVVSSGSPPSRRTPSSLCRGNIQPPRRLERLPRRPDSRVHILSTRVRDINKLPARSRVGGRERLARCRWHPLAVAVESAGAFLAEFQIRRHVIDISHIG